MFGWLMDMVQDNTVNNSCLHAGDIFMLKVTL